MVDCEAVAEKVRRVWRQFLITQNRQTICEVLK